MHGRPRKSPRPEDAAASAAKATKLRSLQSQFLSNHHNKVYSKEALEVSAKLLETNPESYTAWNYRKLAVEHQLSQPDLSPDSVKGILDEELKVVETALRQNFKSYGAWHHRKWVLSKGESSIDHELSLLDRLQKADSRNFHAWNHRRFVTQLMQRSEEDELKYATDMINTNFSNYSAWHNRSVLLSNLMRKKADGYFLKEKVLKEEYELVHQAIFTDPDDQSGWFYHLWLLDQTVTADAPFLVSSWPLHGSDLIVSQDGFQCRAQFYSFPSESRTLPIILYFNQAVEGVCSSTVTVDTGLKVSNNLVWGGLLSNNSQFGQAWVTFLNFSDLELQFTKTYTVKVSLGHCQGIVTSNGSHYSQPTEFSFMVCLQRSEVMLAERKAEEMFSWRSENFLAFDAHSRELSSVISSLNPSLNDENDSSPANWREETIANEIALFRELSEMNCKIGKLSLARLLAAHDAILSPYANRMIHSREVLKLYDDLITLDPQHHRYYKDQRSIVLFQQIFSNRESLLKHCFHYKGQMSSRIDNLTCLWLNNKSLSRLGSVQKLLWVQMLDLSHNQLQSIEGMEAMQLLSYVNLSYNKLCSFTALEPLRRLKSLKVLDISYNEIGSHSIDTRRYLCSSPLSHTEAIDWNQDVMVPGVDITNYWEAYLAFEGLNLVQLDIRGNAIADENFKSFVPKVMCSLRWLDGNYLH